MNDRTKAEIMLDNIKSEDGSLRYSFMTTLENIAMVKFICGLWMKHSNTQQSTNNFFNFLVPPIERGFNRNKFHSILKRTKLLMEWSNIESAVKQEVHNLHLHYDVSRKLINVISLVRNAINNWISYHDEYIFHKSKYSAVDFIDSITWTPRGKIDYAQTAKNILANQGISLSNNDKFELACAYCLEDEIAILDPSVKHPCGDVDLNPMVHFWTGNKGFSNPSYYFRILLDNNKIKHNEVPIGYIWDKLSEKEKSENIIPLIKKLENQDLIYSVLSNLNYQQQQEVFKECSDSILSGILKDWLWEEYFLPTAFHILDILKPSSYLNILNKILEQRRNTFLIACKWSYLHYNSIFMQLWQKSSMQFKNFIFEHENGITLSNILLCSLNWKLDMEVIDLIFNDLNTQQKKKLIFGNEGLRHCVSLIDDDEWDDLELFVNYILSSEEDIKQLKERVIAERGYGNVMHYIDRGEFDKLNKFLTWAFKSEEEIHRFKQSFPYAEYRAALGN